MNDDKTKLRAQKVLNRCMVEHNLHIPADSPITADNLSADDITNLAMLLHFGDVETFQNVARATGIKVVNGHSGKA